jgi:pyruvate formate-lyase activating enzyme-like uncharacterized protein
LVLLITGLCAKGCFYCPLSAERRDKDVIYANEVKIEAMEQAITEARMIDAEGMGVTGGEPLLNLPQTVSYMRAFKHEFGEDFHIHLYTAINPISVDVVNQLLVAGLDELRLHRFTPGEDLHEIQLIMRRKTRLGFEIPAIPGWLEQMKDLLYKLDKLGLDFVNINELEFAPLNADELGRRGYQLEPGSVAAVKGSEETAIALLEWAEENTSLNVHFCPIKLKDGVQLRNRFRRRAKHVAKPFERITTEGLLMKGIIIPPPSLTLKDAFEILCSEYEVPEHQLCLNSERSQLETSVLLVKRLARRLKLRGFHVGIAEEHPTDNRLQVTYTPL